MLRSVKFGSVLVGRLGCVESCSVTSWSGQVGRLRLGALSCVEFGYVLAVELCCDLFR